MEKGKAIINFQKLLDKAVRFLSSRPRSEKEVKDYLYKKRPRDEELRERVLVELRALDLVDDREFVRWWLEQRATFRPRGEMLLVAELLRKGIDKDLIEMTVKGKIKELPLARKVISRKEKALSGLPFFKKRKKIGDFLLRRGFSYETVKKILDEKLKKK